MDNVKIKKASDTLKFDTTEQSDKELLDNDWVIDSIIDVHTADPSLSEEEIDDNSNQELTKLTKENITFDANIPQDVKRGQIVWITAFIKRKDNTTYYSSARQAVIKVRVVDIYFGYSHLSKVNNQK